MTSTRARLTTAAIILLSLNVLLLFAAQYYLAIDIWVTIGLLLCMFLVSAMIIALLAIAYRDLFRTGHGWKIWATCIVLFVIMNLFMLDFLSAAGAIFGAGIILLFTLSVFAVAFATYLLAYYIDIGLTLAAWMSVLFIWSILIVWRLEGNVFELLTTSLSNPTYTPGYAILSNVFALTFCLIPIGILTFLLNTVRLILREFTT